jgi:hypothetical protein
MTTTRELTVQEPWASPSANTGPQAVVPQPAGAKYISAKQQLARMGGVSYTTLQRTIDRDPKFPRPIYFGKRRYFKVSDIEKYERDCEMQAATKAAAKAAADAAKAAERATD